MVSHLGATITEIYLSLRGASRLVEGVARCMPATIVHKDCDRGALPCIKPTTHSTVCSQCTRLCILGTFYTQKAGHGYSAGHLENCLICVAMHGLCGMHVVAQARKTTGNPVMSCCTRRRSRSALLMVKLLLDAWVRYQVLWVSCGIGQRTKLDEASRGYVGTGTE